MIKTHSKHQSVIQICLFIWWSVPEKWFRPTSDLYKYWDEKIINSQIFSKNCIFYHGIFWRYFPSEFDEWIFKSRCHPLYRALHHVTYWVCLSHQTHKNPIAKLSPQLQVKLCLKAELALISANPATHPHPPPPPPGKVYFPTFFSESWPRNLTGV